MVLFRRWFSVVVLVSAVLVVSCAGQGAQSAGPTSVPATATAMPATATSVPATAAPTGGPAKLNLDEIFPPGEGKDLVMNNCGTCHSWVCAIILQRSAEHWETARAAHLGLTAALSEEQIDTLWAYLAENFNDTKPEPSLPKQFRDLGCMAQ